jgi:serine/threonine-protein kinase PpkA
MAQDELSPEELSLLLGSYMPDIQGYRVLRQIGKGGMSYVYLGVQVSLDRQVAIKVMSPAALADEKSKERFEQEARTIAKLEHPCIVGIHEVGRTPQGLMYYVMPYLAKGHLGQRDFTGEETRVVDVLRSLLSALEYAHTRGIVHRDVKAENVLFDNADRPLLTDFGIALTRRDSTRITTAGLAIGSGGYMSPEQARGEPVDGRADLYSVGVLTYELLCGQLPFQSPDPLGLALMHAQDTAPRLPVQKAHWQSFVDRAMAKSPANRFKNAQQMLGALEQIAQKSKPTVPIPSVPSGKQPAAPPPEPAQPAQRMTPQIIAIVLASGVLLLALVLLWLRFGTETESRKQDFYVPTADQSDSGAAAGDIAASDQSTPELADTAAPAESVARVITDASIPLEPPPAPAAPEPVEEAPASGLSPWRNVSADVTVARLDYDPEVPGAKQLSTARRQLDRRQLTAPANDNALDSLAAAHKLGADAAALARLDVEAINAVAKSILDQIRSGRDDGARGDYQRASGFARDSQQQNSPAWKSLRAGLVAPMVDRLEAATQQRDGAAIDRAKALALALELDPAQLEPAWSRAVPPQAPAPVVRTANSSMATLRPGLEVMRNEVTRAEYAQFAQATGREAAKCRNRQAPISLKKRSWSDPGFEQAEGHPVVCVSYDDAAAYAQWLGQRTGRHYRLPTFAEWRLIAGYTGNADPCQDGRINCGPDGTVPASQGPSSPLGLNGAHGNVREWLEDCAGGCNRHLIGGLGWRDSAKNADPLHSSQYDSHVGLDDVGFRLVLEAGQ